MQLTLHIFRALANLSSDLTLAVIMAASTHFGKNLNKGASRSKVVTWGGGQQQQQQSCVCEAARGGITSLAWCVRLTMNSPVKATDIDVLAPSSVLIADRVKEPEMVWDWKNEPPRQPTPSAMSSWLASTVVQKGSDAQG